MIVSPIGSRFNNNLNPESESKQLPALPRVCDAVAPPDPDFQVNTSALRRAFPDFSQYGSSEEDSIEFGRALNQKVKCPLSKTLPSDDVSENIQFSFDNGDKYQVTCSPPIGSRKAPKGVTTEQSDLKTDASTVLGASQKENVKLLAKTMDYVSGSSSKGSRDGQQSLAELHARVDSDDSILLSDRRLHAINLVAKKTKFENSRSKNDLSGDSATQLPKFTVSKASNPSQALNNGTVTSILSAANNTILPDLPDITYLVSGLPQEPTPSFSRITTSRSRFTMPLQSRRGKAGKPAHAPIESVPVSAEEQALFVSLQMLQAKVAVLEEQKAASELKADKYEMEVLELRFKLEEQEIFWQNHSGLCNATENAKYNEWENEQESEIITTQNEQFETQKAD